jgi:type II restriction/modification system DNA methylase subunit YeeA
VKPDEQPVAASRLRDPRTLKLLDPACGSMHFGLYAFDLFFEIYREAWDWEQEHGPGSLDISTQPSAHFKPLNQTYADQASFLRDVPRLIIEHNILRRGHRPARRADRITGLMAAGPARLA